MSDSTRGPDRFEAVVIGVVYVLPVTVAVVVLVLVGLPGLALALLAIEAGVSAAVVVAKRRDGAPVSALAVGLGLVAAVAGPAAVLLLTPGGPV